MIQRMIHHFRRSLFRRIKQKGARYVPGTLGLSAVSAAIKADYGVIASRRERKLIAKRGGKSFKAYYNGEVVKR